MGSLLNQDRPPSFCPGCSNDRVLRALDEAFQNMGLAGHQIAIVSDIGCSGLFDTFFHTHALHGLHGRALTYATGLKLAQPELKVVVTMGDGGLGIGGAHLLSACRRNLDLTLLVLNNFNYGMTGGQFSVTTPQEAQVGSGFLNRLERPMDISAVASSAGAAYVTRCSSYRVDLAKEIESAIRFEGFSVMDIWGLCVGRYLKGNKLTPKIIDRTLANLEPFEGPVEINQRKEYGGHYRELSPTREPVSSPARIDPTLSPPGRGREEVVILGSAGQRVITAGEVLCYAGLAAGLNVTQKSEYRGTVRRGPSVTEVILSPDEIDFTGIEKPSIIVALDKEGVPLRRHLFERIEVETLVLCAAGVEVPTSRAEMYQVDLKSQRIKAQDWALASLSVLAKRNRVITLEMLRTALGKRFKEPVLTSALDLIDRVESGR